MTLVAWLSYGMPLAPGLKQLVWVNTRFRLSAYSGALEVRGAHIERGSSGLTTAESLVPSPTPCTQKVGLQSLCCRVRWLPGSCCSIHTPPALCEPPRCPEARKQAGQPNGHSLFLPSAQTGRFSLGLKPRNIPGAPLKGGKGVAALEYSLMQGPDNHL